MVMPSSLPQVFTYTSALGWLTSVIPSKFHDRLKSVYTGGVTNGRDEVSSRMSYYQALTTSGVAAFVKSGTASGLESLKTIETKMSFVPQLDSLGIIDNNLLECGYYIGTIQRINEITASGSMPSADGSRYVISSNKAGADQNGGGEEGVSWIWWAGGGTVLVGGIAACVYYFWG